MTLTRSDERIAAYVAECGMEGYGFYWALLETIAMIMDKTDKCEAAYSIPQWASKLEVSQKKMKTFLKSLSKHFLMESEFLDSILKIKVPKLLKYRDEYSQRSGQTPDKLPTNSRQTPDQDTEAETETETKEKKEKNTLSGKSDDSPFLSDQKTKKSQERAQRRSEAIEVLDF